MKGSILFLGERRKALLLRILEEISKGNVPTIASEEEGTFDSLIDDLKSDRLVCRHCGGPVKQHTVFPFILHDNSDSWYAGRQMDHDPA